jgi:predicted dehydrogenase
VKRILVVGGGLIGARHVASVKAHDRCVLTGLVDPRHDVGAQYRSMTEVTDSVDGVIIATPTHLHAEQGGYAAHRGWDMLIEKPVAGNLSQADALAAAVSSTGVASLVGHHRRYHAPVQQLKHLIVDGIIGTPVCANLIWAMRKPDSYFNDNWRTVDGSPVMINLVHDIDLLRFVIGEIGATSALRGAGQRSDTRIESGAIALAFENGATGTINFADTTPSPWGFEAGLGENPNIGTTGQDMLCVMGTKGAISFPSMTLWSGTDWGTAATRQPLKPAQNIKNPLDAQLDHFIDVMDGADPLIDVTDATRTLDLALQIETQLTAQMEGTTHVRSANA